MKPKSEKELVKLYNLLEKDKPIGNELIRLYDENIFFDYINNQAENILINSIDSPLNEKSNYYIVIISLSFIALKYYNGSLWEHIEDTYKKLYSMYNEQKIYRKIIDILSLFEKTATRYINYPLCNSIVPEYYLDKYFEFMFDIYKINFQTSLPENLNEELKFIFLGLSDSISSEKDELEINVTNKTYKLIKTTLDIIKNKVNIDSLIELSGNVLKCIDSYWYYDTTVKYSDSSYLQAGFKTWKSKNEDIEKIRKYNKSLNTDNRSAWKSKYKLINNKIYLFTPIHRIRKEHDPKNIRILIYNGDDTIYLEKNPIIEESIGGGYIVKPQNVEINNPIGELTYILFDGDKEIYNSKDSLYRDFIAFEKNGSELKNNTEYEGDLIIAIDKLDNLDIPIIANYDKYILGEKIVSIGDFIQINDSYLILSNRINPHILGEKNEQVYAINNNKNIEVYTKISKLIFETDSELNNIIVLLDKKRNKLSNLLIDVESKNTYYCITIYLDNIKIDDDYHKVEIIDITKDKTLAEFEFITDKKFDFCCEKIKNRNYEILVDSSFELKNELLENSNDFYINIDNAIETEIYFYSNDSKFQYIISLPIQFYKINDGMWNEFGDYIWGKDIFYYSKLNLKNINFDKIVLTDKNNNELVSFNYDAMIIDIDFIKKYEDEYDELKIKFLKQELEVNYINILNMCKYDENNSCIQYDGKNDVLKVKTSYYGKNSVILKVINNFSKKTIEKIELNNMNSYNLIYNLHPLWQYEIIFEEKSLDFFSNPRCIHSELITLYNINHLENKYYKINTAFYGYPLDNLKLMEIRNTFIWIDEKVGDKKYKGRIYQITSDRKLSYKSNVNPVLMEVLSDTGKETIEVMIVDEKNEDGLLLDKNKQTIYDGDNKTLDDIYMYEIILEKRKR